MHIRGLNRWQAFGIHLLISLIIFLVLLAIIVYSWFPGFLINAGGWQGIKIIAGIDLVLGPLLTLIVFNPKKKELPRDLTIISLIQVICLSVGVWIVNQERPLAIVFHEDSFYIAPKSMYKIFNQNHSFLNDFPGVYPKLLYTEIPKFTNKEGYTALLNSINGTPLYLRKDLSKSLLSNKANVEKIFNIKPHSTNPCIDIEVSSPHISGRVCFDHTQKILRSFIKE